MIRIEHTSNPLNYGTNMMVTNFMYYLDKYTKQNNEYKLDVYNEKDLINYKKQYKEARIKRETIDYSLTYSNNLIEKVSNKIKRKIAFEFFYNKKVDKLIKTNDKLVVLGGDDLSEYYGIDSILRELNRLEKIKKYMKVYLVGQTIGPFYNERIDIAKKSMSDVPIYSRDPWTTKYLRNELDLNSVSEAADLAFLPLPYQNDNKIKENILNKYSLIENNYITLVPSGLYKSYCSNKNSYVENWIDIVEQLSIKYPDKKIVLLPHVLRYSQYDDRNIINSIKDKMGDSKNIVYIVEEMTPLEARFILGNGILTITGRMHGAISTFQMRKPAISISYSVKYNGVIGEGLGLTDTIVEAMDDKEWENNQVSKNVIRKVEEIQLNREKYINKINESVDKAIIKAQNMIADIANQII